MSDSTPFLDDPDLQHLTGRRQKSRQIAWLRSERIPFRVSATGHPVVLWTALENKNLKANEGWRPKVLEV